MKTILILVDGMRPDALAEIPLAQSCIKEAAATLQAQTVFPPVTLPCHMSLFHSVAPDRHGITTNTYVPQVRPIDGLFEVLKQNGKKCAAFYDWEALREISRPGSLAHSGFRSGGVYGYENTAPLLAEDLIVYAKENAPDFAFLFLGYPDAAGHKHGWMRPEYLAAVSACWDLIGMIMDALGDDYVYIITADHGGHDRTHGADIPEDMRTPLVIKGKNITPTLENASILDLAPTIAKLQSTDPNPEWEGKSLI